MYQLLHTVAFSIFKYKRNIEGIFLEGFMNPVDIGQIKNSSPIVIYWFMKKTHSGELQNYILPSPFTIRLHSFSFVFNTFKVNG